MRRLKRHNATTKRYVKPIVASCITHMHLPSIILPKGFAVENGFLTKNGTIISFTSEALMETAVQGFLHIDEDESYNPY
jgi:hypothetical protein